MTTWCEDCNNVSNESRKSDPRYWVCLKAKRDVPPGFVVRGTWTNGQPYERCSWVNPTGECEMFEPLKDVTKEK